MSGATTTSAVVVATTTLRVPLPGNPPNQVMALVETGAGRRLVTLAVHPDRRPEPGETIQVGLDE